MVNETRKILDRNFRYAEENAKIDEEIERLQNSTLPDAQTRINYLQQQRNANYNRMSQPMTAQEYAEYDNTGSQQNHQNNGFGQMVSDGINHAAQGVSFGFSDELFGAIGGAGRVTANGLLRAIGKPVNNESFSDAWRNGYNEYRDYTRQELQDGYERNPAISGVSELAGSAISPIKIMKTPGYAGKTFGKVISHPTDIARTRTINALGNGFIQGIGETDSDSLLDYGKNITTDTVLNLTGTKIGNKLFGKGNDMYELGRRTINGAVQSIPYIYNTLNEYN